MRSPQRAARRMGFSETFGLAFPAIFRNRDIRLSLFANLGQFGTPQDLPLDDLKIELYFPAVEKTTQLLKVMTG